jgi:peroxiredoxin
MTTKTTTNHLLWIAPLVALFGFLSYFFLFIRWPTTREVPIVNAAILLAAFGLAIVALRRAQGRQRWHRLASWTLLPLAPALAVLLGLYCTRGSALPPPLVRGLVAGDSVPELRATDQHGSEVSLTALTQGRALLVFFRGAWCLFCKTQLSELQGELARFDQSAVKVVAISAGSVDENRALAQELGLDYRLLSDPTLQIIDRFGVRHEREGKLLPVPLPAMFLVEDGQILWRDVSENYRVRPHMSELLARFAQLPAPARTLAR